MASWGPGVSLQGPAGQPGSKILFGTGAPASTLGAVGDVYFQTDTNYIFQKGASGWPTQGYLLQGAAGLMGMNGFSIDAGPNNPTSSDGKAGDFFVNYATGEVFGPKGSDNSWPDTGMSIKGPAGVAGAAGAQGPQGSVGPQGNPGLRGTQTFYGQGAPTQQTIANNNAMPGDNYYDLTPGAVTFYVLGN